MTDWIDRCLEMNAFAPAGGQSARGLGDPIPSMRRPAPSCNLAQGSIEAALESIDGTEPVVLAYDGSLEGLLASVYVAFASRHMVEEIAEGRMMQLRLGQRVVPVPTDVEAAMRVQRSICRSLGRECWRAVAAAGASDDPSRANAVLAFLRYALTPERTRSCNACPSKATCTSACDKIPRNRLTGEWANPQVEPLLALQRSVANEAERMRQFIRFEHTSDDFWVARCNPKCTVVPFVMGHFARRFNTQSFVIYDEVHQMAGISRDGRWQIVRTDYLPELERATEEDDMQDAWKRFYRALSIDERYHPELRRQFMPVRLWKNLPEI